MLYTVTLRINIVTCFLGNMTRKFTWLLDLDEYLLYNHSLHYIHTYNVFGWFLFNAIHSRTANLSEVSSALLGAQLSLALVEAKPTGLL
jgi:hypothetical protein